MGIKSDNVELMQPTFRDNEPGCWTNIHQWSSTKSKGFLRVSGNGFETSRDHNTQNISASLPMITAKKKCEIFLALPNQLESAVDTLALLTMELEKKRVSIQRLRRLIFGSSSEKTREVFEDDTEDKTENDSADGDNNTREEQPTGSEGQKPKRKGHGRRSAEQYRGAQTIKVGHQKLKSGDS